VGKGKKKKIPGKRGPLRIKALKRTGEDKKRRGKGEVSGEGQQDGGGAT